MRDRSNPFYVSELQNNRVAVAPSSARTTADSHDLACFGIAHSLFHQLIIVSPCSVLSRGAPGLPWSFHLSQLQLLKAQVLQRPLDAKRSQWVSSDCHRPVMACTAVYVWVRGCVSTPTTNSYSSAKNATVHLLILGEPDRFQEPVWGRDGDASIAREQRRDGVVLLAAAEERPGPLEVVHTAGVAEGDHARDRADLPPRPTAATATAGKTHVHRI